MKYHRSGLGDIHGLGMINKIEGMLIAGQKSLEEDQLKRQEKEDIEDQRSDRLNQAYVKKEDSVYTVRLEQTQPNWICAFAATGKDYGQTKCYSFFDSSLRHMFPDAELRKHMIMEVSPTKKQGYEEINFRFDAEDYGGNVYFKNEGHRLETCFGQGCELFVEMLGLEHNKPKSAWIKISGNNNIADLL